MRAWIRYLSHLWRYVARRPGHTAAVIAVLAAGLSIYVAVMSTLSAFLLRPLPVRDIDRLVRVRERQLNPDGGVVATYSLSPASWAWWREHSRAFEDMAAATSDARTLTDLDPPERVDAALVSANFFDVLGIEPIQGRGFRTGEDQPGAEQVVIISYSIWQRVFAGRPSAVGGTLHLDGAPFRVVGVMPKGLAHPYDARIWTPLVLGGAIHRMGGNYLYAPARLKPGIDVRAAERELSATAAAMRREAPELTLANGASATPLRTELLGDLIPALTALGLAAVLVLAISLFNAANLIMARSLAESRQVAVRLAMGATSGRILREALGRYLALVGVATAAAVGFARWIVPPLAGLSGRSAIAEFDSTIRIDWTTAGIAVFTSVLVAVVVALVEVVRTRRLVLTEALTNAGRSISPSRTFKRTMQGLAGAQLVLAFLLLTAALAVTTGYGELLSRDRGFDPNGLMLLDLSFPTGSYPTTRSRITFLEAFEAKVRAIPGVASVSACTVTPDYEGTWGARFNVPGTAPPDPPGYFLTHHRIVMPGYFETLGIPLLTGRTFTSSDLAEDSDQVIVSRSFAERYFPDGNAVGSVLQRGGPNTERRELRVVGVVGDVDDMGEAYDWDDRYAWYLPASQGVDYDFSQITVAVRVADPDRELLGPIRGALASLDPGMAASKVGAMQARMGAALSRERFSALLYGAFAVAGVLVGVLGVYGMISFLTAIRMREFGIRLAVGAEPLRVQAIVVRQVAWTLLGALVTGILLAGLAGAALSRTVSMPVEMTPRLLCVALVVLGAATFAAVLPSCRRVARIEPSRCLRED